MDHHIAIQISIQWPLMGGLLHLVQRGEDLPLESKGLHEFVTSDKGGGICDCPLCLSMPVCLLARLLKNACMDLDEILRVDRCRDMDELINFSA